MATPKLILIFFVSLFVVSAKATGLQFEVAHRLGEKVVRATVKNGIRGSALGTGFTLTVNGTVLKFRSVPMKGVFYEAAVPRLESYEMTMRGPGSIGAAHETKLVATERKFETALVSQVSTRQDLVIPYSGNRISSREKLLVKLISKQKLFLNRKSIVLTAVLDGNKIVIPKSSLAKFKGGTARLHVALYSDQSEPAANGKSTYTVSNEQSVTINGH